MTDSEAHIQQRPRWTRTLLTSAAAIVCAVTLGMLALNVLAPNVAAAPEAQEATPVPAASVAPLTESQIRNAAVIVPSIDPAGTVQLVDGVLVNDSAGTGIRIADVPIVTGDLTGDGIADAVIVLDISLSDGTVSTDLVVLANQNGAPVATAALRLGSPAQIERLYIDRGAIWLDMRTAGPLDDPCCPSIPQKRILVLQGNTLLNLPAIATGRLFPYKVGEKFGYVNALGEFIVPPQYAYAGPFREGIALVSFDAGRYGYINMMGQVVIPMRYSFGSAFAGGVAVVGVPALSPDLADSVIYIDRAGNNIFGEASFAAGLPFHEGLAAVRSPEGKYGYVNRRGVLSIPAVYDLGLDFSEGLAPVLAGDKIGYIDRFGNVAIQPQYDAGDRFSEGLAAVAQAGKVGYIDQRGAFAVQPAFDQGGWFQNGLAPVSLNGVEFYIDISGSPVITQPLMTDLRAFSEGLAAVRVDGKLGYVDTSGAMVIAPQYTSGTDFEDGLAVVETEQTWSVLTFDGTVLVQLAKPVVAEIADTSAATSTASLAATTPITVPPAPAETEIIRFSPSIPDEIRAGSCIGGSNVISATTAFRCGVDNIVYDPCLLAGDTLAVVCGADPALGAEGFVLELTQPLPSVTLEGRSFPGAWLFQLANGAICRFNEGQSISVDGQRIQYVCSDLTQLLGDIDKTTALWTVNIVTTRDDGAGNYTVDTLTPTTILRSWAPLPPPLPPTPPPSPTPTETLAPGVTPTEAATPTPASLPPETPVP